MFFVPTSLFANEQVGTLAKDWFTNFSNTINKKYSEQNQVSYYKNLSEKLEELVTKKSLNEKQVTLIQDLIKLSNERVFFIERNIEETPIKNFFNSNTLVNNFKYISYNKENIFLDDWIWYTYKFDNHLTFPKSTIIKKQDLEYNWIKENSTLAFIREDWELWYANNFSKVKLISNDIIYWIPNKYNFLIEIKNDKKTLSYETDIYFSQIKNISQNLTYRKNINEKIKLLYDYVLSNIEYPTTFSLNNPRIFSWIDTYVDKKWVCEWYTKLLQYMLNFAWIWDTEVIRWYVIDAQDFPQIWHAWIEINNNYYDPTFDDPIWQSWTRKYSEYKYFWLPYDLFYANRFTFDKLPSYLKEEDLEYRKTFIKKRISLLVNKYKDSNYNILKPYILKLNNSIDFDKKLDLIDLKNIMWYYEIINHKINIWWVNKTITNLKYYNITDTDVEWILDQINYNTDWYYLLKRKLDNWIYEYRLAYELIMQ